MNIYYINSVLTNMYSTVFYHIKQIHRVESK